MRLLIGHPDAMPSMSVPVWQNGMPQSMQRAPCRRRWTSSPSAWNSCQSRTRAAGAFTIGSSRGNSRKPVGLPITVASKRNVCRSMRSPIVPLENQVVLRVERTEIQLRSGDIAGDVERLLVEVQVIHQTRRRVVELAAE